MVKDTFDRWWEWVEKPADSPLSVPSHFHEAIMRLAPEQRRDHTTVNEAVRLAARVPHVAIRSSRLWL
jgi:hypothetical protein